MSTDSEKGRFGRPFPILPAAKLLTSDSDGNHVFTAAKTASIPLRVLLVGDHEEGFFLIQEILERNRSLLVADLEHARSLEEAKELTRERAYGRVLFQHDTEDVEAVRLIAEFLHSGLSIPFIVLTEDDDEKSVAEIIQSGTWNCLAKSHLAMERRWCERSAIPWPCIA